MGAKSVTVHIKVVADPVAFTVAEMEKTMIELYAKEGITVNVLSTIKISLDLNEFSHLYDVEVGDCLTGAVLKAQNELINYREDAEDDHIVIYMCRFVSRIAGDKGFYNGCASHPPGKPMAVIASYASKYTMAHELGHVLGLVRHVNKYESLMTEFGTHNIRPIPPAPVFDPSEISVIKKSPYYK